MINPPLFWPNNLFRRDLRTLPGLFRGNVKVKGLVIIGVVPKIDLSVFLWRSSFCPKKPNKLASSFDFGFDGGFTPSISLKKMLNIIRQPKFGDPEKFLRTDPIGGNILGGDSNKTNVIASTLSQGQWHTFRLSLT